MQEDNQEEEQFRPLQMPPPAYRNIMREQQLNQERRRRNREVVVRLQREQRMREHLERERLHQERIQPGQVGLVIDIPNEALEEVEEPGRNGDIRVHYSPGAGGMLRREEYDSQPGFPDPGQSGRKYRVLKKKKKRSTTKKRRSQKR